MPQADARTLCPFMLGDWVAPKHDPHDHMVVVDHGDGRPNVSGAFVTVAWTAPDGSPREQETRAHNLKAVQHKR